MVMKRIISLVLVFVSASLLLQGMAIAEKCPLPAVNSTAEITFSGFEWYTDYPTTLKAATQKGFVNKYDWSRDNFDLDRYVTPHWKTILNSINSNAGSEEGCGGYLNYTSDLPKVAGYKIDGLKLYFYWNPKKGPTTNFSAKDACYFYMAVYSFDVTDNQAAYADLVTKLKKIYGNDPYVGESGCGTDYTVWVNADQAAVGISVDEYDVELVYYAPGAEDRLAEVEALVKKKEIDDAADDMSGL